MWLPPPALSGHNFFPSAPGVYCHQDTTRAKAFGYSRFVPATSDGAFWSVVWELAVDRSGRAPVSKLGTDQWVQTEASVRLAALWVGGRNAMTMQNGVFVSDFDEWNLALEKDPLRQRFQSEAPRDSC